MLFMLELIMLELCFLVNTGLVNEQCSIDALLERTIKHMVFLQSVTKHGDKLKQTEESKVWSFLFLSVDFMPLF